MLQLWWGPHFWPRKLLVLACLGDSWRHPNTLLTRWTTSTTKILSRPSTKRKLPRWRPAASVWASSSKSKNLFWFRTYLTAGLGFMGALGSAWVSVGLPALYASPMLFSLGGFVLTLAGLIGCQYIQPTYITEYVNGHLIYKTANSPARIALYSLGLAGLGMTAAPALAMAAAVSPSTIPMAMAMTAAIFGGASLAAYNIPSTKMASIGRILFGSLLGLIGLQIIGLVAHLISGPNMLTSLLFRADNYLGILLFSGFVAYDTHVAMNSYEAGAADHLGMSVQFLLDVWNIFIRLLYLFSQRDWSIIMYVIMIHTIKIYIISERRNWCGLTC